MLSQYEQDALNASLAWKNQESSLVARLFAPVGNVIGAIPGVEAASRQLVKLLSGGAFRTVRTGAILEDFRNSGHSVSSLKDIRALPLEEVDKVVKGLGAKYRGLAASEGALSGAVGLAGIPVGIVGVVGIAARCVGEYACYYGYDISDQREQVYAMQLMASASSAAARKSIFLKELNVVARQVAKKATWKVLEEHAMVRVVRKVADTIGFTLTKRSLGKAVPLAGPGVGAVLDVWYLSDVIEAAENLYRERFLADQKGDPSLIRG